MNGETVGRSGGRRSTTGRITLQITTMNKASFCLDNLRLLADDPAALELLQEILIVDSVAAIAGGADGVDGTHGLLRG